MADDPGTLSAHALAARPADISVERWLDAVGCWLINDCSLLVAGERHRILEVEAYYCSPDEHHADPFTHGDERQRTSGYWYFHRVGRGYKGGTYKGVDLTIGPPKATGGMLVRAIQRDCDGEIVMGSCKVVEYIMLRNSLPKGSSVGQLVFAFLEHSDADGPEAGADVVPPALQRRHVIAAGDGADSESAHVRVLADVLGALTRLRWADPAPLQLLAQRPLLAQASRRLAPPSRKRHRPSHETEVHHASNAAVLRTARVGLSLKRGVAGVHEQFVLRPYRFVAAHQAAELSKGRVHTACALLLAGGSCEEVARACGASAAVVRRYRELIEAGRTARQSPGHSTSEARPSERAARLLKPFLGKTLSTAELCRLHGVIDEAQWPGPLQAAS